MTTKSKKTLSTMTIEELKQRVISGELEVGIYDSQNQDGESIIVEVLSDNHFTTKTLQQNDWIRINEYIYNKESDSWEYGETYDK